MNVNIEEPRSINTDRHFKTYLKLSNNPPAKKASDYNHKTKVNKRILFTTTSLFFYLFFFLI